MNETSETAVGGTKRSNLKKGFRAVHLSLIGLAAIIRVGWSALKGVVTVSLILGLLATNIATIALEPVQRLLSTGYDTVTGAASVNKKLRSQIVTAEGRLAAEQATTARLSKTLAAREAALGKASKETKRLGARSSEVRTITQRMTKRTVKSASLSVENIIPMAVPAAGIIAIVGFTALDLKWSCETLKDIRALELALDAGSGQPDGKDVTQVCGLKVPTTEDLWDNVKSTPTWLKDHMPRMPW